MQDYIVKLKPVIAAGHTAEECGVEQKDLRWHVYGIQANTREQARGKALDCFHQEVPIEMLEWVDIHDSIKLADSEEENTNCLRGFKCPSCGQTEAFNIQIKTICRVTDDGTETLGDCEWDDSNFCGCCKCPHIGTVRDFTKPPLPPDPEGQNGDRARWASEALEAFMLVTGCDQEDAVCDLVADLRHWCDRTGMDWERELARGLGHYDEETTELDPNTDAIDREENQ